MAVSTGGRDGPAAARCRGAGRTRRSCRAARSLLRGERGAVARSAAMLTARLWQRAVVSVRGGWRWQAVDAARVPRRLLADWERAGGQLPAPLVAGPHWMQCFQRAFLSPGQGQVHAVYHGDRLVGVVPLMCVGRVSRTAGADGERKRPDLVVRARRIGSIHRRAGARDLSSSIAAERGGSWGRTAALGIRPAGPELARARRLVACPAWNSETSGDVSMDLGRSFEDLLRGFSPAPGQGRAAAPAPAVRPRPDFVIERADDEDSVARGAGRLLLEMRTWKGEGGTAMCNDPRVGIFVSKARPHHGAARLGGHLHPAPPQSHRRVRLRACAARRAPESLKIAYDPEDARLAPGNLLTLKRMLERGIDERCGQGGPPGPALAAQGALRHQAGAAGVHAHLRRPARARARRTWPVRFCACGSRRSPGWWRCTRRRAQRWCPRQARLGPRAPDGQRAHDLGGRAPRQLGDGS